MGRYGSSHERFCQICGKRIYAPVPTSWPWRRTDHRRESETYGRVLYFCGSECEKEYEKQNPRKTYNTMR